MIVLTQNEVWTVLDSRETWKYPSSNESEIIFPNLFVENVKYKLFQTTNYIVGVFINDDQ